MKIAFAISGKDLSSPIDEKFGRAPRFLVFDGEKKNFAVIENPAAQEAQGAGIKAAEAVIRAGAKAVVAGECGPKATDVLNAAGVKIFPAKPADVKQALALYFGVSA
jgi:predicted Fe-Mo cluster-binding NifX family protein